MFWLRWLTKCNALHTERGTTEHFKITNAVQNPDWAQFTICGTFLCMLSCVGFLLVGRIPPTFQKHRGRPIGFNEIASRNVSNCVHDAL